MKYLRDNVGDGGIYDFSLEAYRHGHDIERMIVTIMRIVAVRFVRPISCQHPCLAPMLDLPCFAIGICRLASFFMFVSTPEEGTMHRKCATSFYHCMSMLGHLRHQQKRLSGRPVKR